MPMPLWWGQVNKRVFNPAVLRSGLRPVITHVGRSSGTTYRTPLDAWEVDGTYVFILVYGSRADWVRNVLAQGSARLNVDDRVVDLTAPRLLAEDRAWELLDGIAKRPPRFLNITEYLQMDIRSP